MPNFTSGGTTTKLEHFFEICFDLVTCEELRGPWSSARERPLKAGQSCSRLLALFLASILESPEALLSRGTSAYGAACFLIGFAYCSVSCRRGGRKGFPPGKWGGASGCPFPTLTSHISGIKTILYGTWVPKRIP